MKMGKIETYIRDIIEKDGVVFFGLIDPLYQKNNNGPVKCARAFN